MNRVACLTLAVFVMATALGGDASAQSRPSEACGARVPDYLSRAVTRVDGGLRVSVAVLSTEESERVYGAPLSSKAIQPVWVRIENHDDRAYYMLFPGLDPDFFPASEAAEAFGTTPAQQAELTRRFRDLGFRNPVLAGTTTQGFVLTHLDAGGKLVQIDLVGSGVAKTFAILTGVPGFRADFHESQVFKREFYAPDEVVDYDDDTVFLAALERLPCCVTNKDGSRNGDPLNLVVVGGIDDAVPALVRRGWRPTEQKWTGSVIRTVTSALSGDRYSNAPVSDLYLYGRAQDFALQKARDTVHQRNHLRLWLSPMRYRGKDVWVGQISRDIGSRMTTASSTLTTHKIDPDVDEARNALAEDMAYSQNLSKLGAARGVGVASKASPRENLTTDPYYTDGLRVVLVFDRKPTSLTAIEFLPGDLPIARSKRNVP
jgi:hypothetical protein